MHKGNTLMSHQGSSGHGGEGHTVSSSYPDDDEESKSQSIDMGSMVPVRNKPDDNNIYRDYFLPT
jgi:hypothetical protein